MKFPSRFSYLVLSAFLALGFLPEKANAQLACAGQASVTYSPGLTNTPQQVTVTVDHQFELCSSGVLPPLLTSARTHAEFTAILSCNDLLGDTDGQSVIEWGPGVGGNSVWDWTGTAIAAGANIQTLFVGEIVSGPFHGRSANASVTLSPLLGANPISLLCNTPQGVTELQGAMALIIL